MYLRFEDESKYPPVSLDDSPLLIGQHADAEVRFEEKTVNRRHALLARYLSGWLVHDLCSLNGVRVNGKKVRNAPLSVNDQLAFGLIKCTVLEDAATDDDAPSTEPSDAAAEEDWFADVLTSEESKPVFSAVCRLDFYLESKLIRSVSVREASVIGSSPRVDISLPRRRIGSRQCLIASEGGSWSIHDLKSETGMRLRGKRERTFSLEHGDVIEIGDYRMYIHLSPETDELDQRDELAVTGPVSDATRYATEPQWGSVPPPAPVDTEYRPSGSPGGDSDPAGDELADPADPFSSIETDVGAVWSNGSSPPDATNTQVERFVERAKEAEATGDRVRAILMLGKACEKMPFRFGLRRALRQLQKQEIGRTPEPHPLPFFASWRVLWRQLAAKWAIDRNDLRKVLAIAERGLRDDPWNKELLLAQALAFEHFGQIDLCRWTLMTARERDPDDPNFNRPLAKIMQYAGLLELALLFWDQVRKAEPENTEVEHQVNAIYAHKTMRKIRGKHGVVEEK